MGKIDSNNYNQWHQNREVDLDINTPWHQFVSAYLLDMDLKENKILEIGCGRGGFAYWIAKNFNTQYKEFVAADFSSTAIDMGKGLADQKGLEGINWSLQDIMKIEFPDNYFDVVISCETIEHIPEPYMAVQELYRVTKPNGLLLLTTPNYGNFMGLYRIYLRLTGRRWKEVGQPINKFVIYDLTKFWLKRAGFRIVFSDSKNILYVSPFKKATIKLNWTKPNWIVKKLGINSFFIGQK